MYDSEFVPRWRYLNLQILLDSCLWGWMKSKVYKRKVDTRDELVACILDAVASVKEIKEKLRRTTRDFRTRVAKYVEVEGGILGHLL